MRFSIEDHQVLIDGRPAQILSGAIHYFRTMPEQWEDRLLKLRNCGFNTVETYIAWHLHELVEGRFDFSGRLDFVRFIQLAGRLGLHVIVRPGPYICSECDLGGMPGWLLGKPGIRLRCRNEVFLECVHRYFARIMPMLAPLQCTHGGPIIAMQVENEYGSYAADRIYMRTLVGYMRDGGVDVQLFTSDGNVTSCMQTGTLPELPVAVNYRNHPRQSMKTLDSFDTGYPNAHLTMEMWAGRAWHWGKRPEHHRDDEVAQDMREALEDRDSVNVYMFHGGTNFGFTSGANYDNGVYLPLLTSYEVDAVLNEAGNPTLKYHAIQKVMEECRPGSTAPVAPSPSRSYLEVELTECVGLGDSLEALSEPHELPLPETMESFGQSFGFIHYSAVVEPWHSDFYECQNMRDRAIVLLNGNPVATIYRSDPISQQRFYLNVVSPHSRLEILVENMGRINFCGEMEQERKGMTGCCRVGQSMHVTDWTVRPLPLDDWSKLNFGVSWPRLPVPAFYAGDLFIDEEPVDTFLCFPEGVRGYVQVNGFNIGRYWTIGPQRTLYVPAPVLRKGRNRIVVLELHGLRSRTLHFTDRRVIDPMSDMVLS